jgi:hypothetical protein
LSSREVPGLLKGLFDGNLEGYHHSHPSRRTNATKGGIQFV